MDWNVTVEGVDYGPVFFEDRRGGTRWDCVGCSFYCVYCGRIWATVRREATPTFPVVHPCESCGSPSQYPGSIWTDYQRDEFARHLPRPLIERELRLHLKYLDFYLTGES